MKVVDLSHTEGCEEVAPNQFKCITRGYPMMLYGHWWLVLAIVPCVRVSPDIDPRDKFIGRLFLRKLTKTGVYSNAKDAVCYTYIRASGKVESSFVTEVTFSPKTNRAIERYNEIVRMGRKWSDKFYRHWAFEKSHEDGLSGFEAVERSQSMKWDGWYS